MTCQRCNAEIENGRSAIYPLCGYSIRGLTFGLAVRCLLRHCSACKEWLHSLEYTFEDRLDGKPDPFDQYATENGELSIWLNPEDVPQLLSIWKEERTPEEVEQIQKGELPLIIDRVRVHFNEGAQKVWIW